MNRHTLMLTIAILWFFVIANVPLYATHCQIHGSVNRGSQSGPGLAGWKIVKTPVEGFGMDTVTTDVSGNFQFTLLPGNVTYRIHPIVPIGWFPLDAIAGVNTVNGDSGEVSTSTKIDEMTLDVFVKNGTVNSNNQFIVATSTDTTKYRTARYLDWASTYGGGFQVRKAVKCKFDEAELKLNLVVPRGLEPLSKLELKFNVGPNFLLALWSHAKGNKVPLCYASATNPDAVKFKLWAIDLNCPQTSNPPSADDTVQFDFHGLQGKLRTVEYRWTSKVPGSSLVLKGILPGKPVLPGDTLKQVLGLPMPNLHNVGEGIFGGIMQTPVVITVGSTNDPKGAHTVYHTKYKDVLKSFFTSRKNNDIYHSLVPRCLNTFDANGKQISKRQKSLPPKKHNNVLFAEQLTLKLNVAASDSGIFPQGLGNLIYDNHQVDPSPFDAKTVREIIAQVDSFLGCNQVSKGMDSSKYLTVVQNINNAFSGPLDTISWSCGKVVCTGVKPLKDVPYLHANPSVAQRVDISRDALVLLDEPMEFRLSQNYPNPFNPTTTIEFILPTPAVVTLKVYNTLGQEMATLLDHESMDDGEQAAEFNANTLPSGVYFYRLEVQAIADEETGAQGQLFTSVRKMLLIK